MLHPDFLETIQQSNVYLSDAVAYGDINSGLLVGGVVVAAGLASLVYRACTDCEQSERLLDPVETMLGCGQVYKE